MNTDDARELSRAVKELRERLHTYRHALQEIQGVTRNGPPYYALAALAAIDRIAHKALGEDAT